MLKKKYKENLKRKTNSLVKSGFFSLAISLKEEIYNETKKISDLIALLELCLLNVTKTKLTNKNFLEKKINETTTSRQKMIIKEYLAMCTLLDIYLSPIKVKEITQKNTGKIKLLVILHNSLPYANGGYAIRADGLITALNDKGFEIIAYTRPGYPLVDQSSSFQVKEDALIKNKSKIDYKRIETEVNRLHAGNPFIYMLESYNKYCQIINEHNPDIIYGRSTYLTSFPGLIAARKNNLPFSYEVSGLWELVYQSRLNNSDKISNNKLKSSILQTKRLETLTANKSDKVFTLNKSMQNILIDRGVNKENIFLAPNSGDTDFSKKFTSLNDFNKDKKIFRFGYIGSFQDYEGLDDLIKAFDLLDKSKYKQRIELLLVGDGPYMDEIKQCAENSKYKQTIILTGRVDRLKVIEYYKLIDVCIYPRKSNIVTEAVSPVKPLESMAIGIPIITSSVNPLKEICEFERGIVFKKDNINDLVKKLEYSIVNHEKLKINADNAKEWIKKNRNWAKITEVISNELHTLIK